MIEFIKNPPTLHNLKELYYSELYKTLLLEFERQSIHRLNQRAENEMSLINTLGYTQRRYLILNIPFDEVHEKFKLFQSDLLNYTLLTTDYFIKKKDEFSDGEFPEGEEPGDENKSVVLEVLGISRTFLLDKFCELYLLIEGDEDRLFHYLKTIRIPEAKKYQKEITQLYQQLNN